MVDRRLTILNAHLGLRETFERWVPGFHIDEENEYVPEVFEALKPNITGNEDDDKEMKI